MPSRPPAVTAKSTGKHAGTPGEFLCTAVKAVGTPGGPPCTEVRSATRHVTHAPNGSARKPRMSGMTECPAASSLNVSSRPTKRSPADHKNARESHLILATYDYYTGSHDHRIRAAPRRGPPRTRWQNSPLGENRSGLVAGVAARQSPAKKGADSVRRAV